VLEDTKLPVGHDRNWDDKLSFFQFFPIENGLSSQLIFFIIFDLASFACPVKYTTVWSVADLSGAS